MRLVKITVLQGSQEMQPDFLVVENRNVRFTKFRVKLGKAHLKSKAYYLNGVISDSSCRYGNWNKHDIFHIVKALNFYVSNCCLHDVCSRTTQPLLRITHCFPPLF